MHFRITSVPRTIALWAVAVNWCLAGTEGDRIAEGVKRLNEGKLDAAIDLFTEAIDGNESPSLAYTYRAEAYERKKDSTQALGDLNKAIEHDGKSLCAYLGRANHYLSNDRADKAIEDCTKAITIAPQYAVAYMIRGVAYDVQGELKKSMDDFNVAATLDRGCAWIYFMRGRTLGKRGRVRKAIEDYSKAIELDPRMAEAYNNRGLLHSGQGDFEKAAADFRVAIGIAPDFLLAVSNLKKTYEAAEERYYDRPGEHPRLELSASDMRLFQRLSRSSAAVPSGGGNRDRASDDLEEARFWSRMNNHTIIPPCTYLPPGYPLVPWRQN
jgi:tetratricopeptide (TPR) repeat protein